MSSTVDEIIAASVRGDVAHVAALLRQDPTLGSAANMTGATAIHAAHYSGHPQIVRLFVPASRELDGFLAAELGRAGPHAGQTAADTARAQGQTTAAELLLAQ